VSEDNQPDTPEGPAEGSSPEHDDFARLLETSVEPKRHARGARVKGTIVQIGDTDVLVDVGGKSEATIARAELAGEDGSLEAKVGDEIEATVVSTEGSIRLSRRALIDARDKEAARTMLMEAFKSRMPVAGRVTASIKGGYEVQVGKVRGFCPFSQIDVRRQEDPTLYFNKTFDFRIKEYDPRKNNLILSRRALIEAEVRKQEAEIRAKATVGSVLPGTVVSIQDFGAFIDIGGGVQGLLHVSEMSHARVAHPNDLVKLGETLDVQVLRVDKKKGKISLTRKPLEADPWDGVAERFKQGQVLTARAARVTDFGAFLELSPGVDGLLHVSEMAGLKDGGGGGRNLKAQELVKQGDELTVQIMKVDATRRRVSLGLPGSNVSPGQTVAPEPPPKTGDLVMGKVERVEKFGVFLRLGTGRTGLIPNNELGTPRGTDHRKMFPVGTEMRAEVIESDPGGRKIRLSVSKAEGREEREALDRYRKDFSRSGGSFSTLADAFAAIKKSGPEDGDEPR